jgi:hypothetical protein
MALGVFIEAGVVQPAPADGADVANVGTLLLYSLASWPLCLG